MCERVKSIDKKIERDRVAEDRAKKVLWQKMGGEEQVMEFVRTISEAGGMAFIHGGAARYAEGEERWVSDVDIVILRIEGKTIETIAKSTLIGSHIKARVQRETEQIKTVEMARGREPVADLVCARRNGAVDIEATIEDHLAGCWTVDGRVVAYEVEIEAGDLTLKKIVLTKEADLNPETARADHIWWWFRALVRGEVPEGKREEVEGMIGEFVKMRDKELVHYRENGQSLTDWLSRCEERGRTILRDEKTGKLRVPELGIRIFNNYHAEGVVDKLNNALRSNPEEFWRIGMTTGLLPLVFPALKYIPKDIKMEIEEEMRGLGREATPETRWMALFEPVIKKLVAPIAGVYGKGFECCEWKARANKMLGVNVQEKIPNTFLEERVDMEEEWKMNVLLPLIMMYEKRLLKILGDQSAGYRFKEETCIPPKSVVRVSREVAWIIRENPMRLLNMLMDYLPTGERLNQKRLRSRMYQLLETEPKTSISYDF